MTGVPWMPFRNTRRAGRNGRDQEVQGLYFVDENKALARWTRTWIERLDKECIQASEGAWVSNHTRCSGRSTPKPLSDSFFLPTQGEILKWREDASGSWSWTSLSVFMQSHTQTGLFFQVVPKDLHSVISTVRRPCFSSLPSHIN